jgi:hypothetical protein
VGPTSTGEILCGRSSRGSAFWLNGFLRLPTPHFAHGPSFTSVSFSVSRFEEISLRSLSQDEWRQKPIECQTEH